MRKKIRLCADVALCKVTSQFADLFCLAHTSIWVHSGDNELHRTKKLSQSSYDYDRGFYRPFTFT